MALFGGNNAESLHDEGLTAMTRGDVDKAIDFFTRALQLEPAHAGSAQRLAKCYLLVGKHHEAVALLKQVVQRKPALVSARIDLGGALLNVNAVDEARQQFQAVLDAHPENAAAYAGLASVAFDEGNWDAASSLAATARQLGGPTFAILFLLGRAAMLAGNEMLAESNFSEVEAIIQKSIEIAKPDDPQSCYLRGEVNFARRKYLKALENYRQAELRLCGNKSYVAFGGAFSRIDVLIRQGQCLERMGDEPQAREMGRKALAIDPESKLAQKLAEE